MQKQQIVISGVGGQGVLFITRLLAEAAMGKGFPVLTSETHGMAQRGGTVVSHLKVGDYDSPLIRPHRADGLLILKSENIHSHGYLAHPQGFAVINSTGQQPAATTPFGALYTVNADGFADRVENPKSLNLVFLGAAMGRLARASATGHRLFCSEKDIIAVLKRRMAARSNRVADALACLNLGYEAYA